MKIRCERPWKGAEVDKNKPRRDFIFVRIVRGNRSFFRLSAGLLPSGIGTGVSIASIIYVPVKMHSRLQLAEIEW